MQSPVGRIGLVITNFEVLKGRGLSIPILKLVEFGL